MRGEPSCLRPACPPRRSRRPSSGSAATATGSILPTPPSCRPRRSGTRLVLVVWAPASEMRPHRAPARDGTPRYWIRLGSETVDAERRGDLIRGLVQQTARVPWDDRRATLTPESRISGRRRSASSCETFGAGSSTNPNAKEIYRRMRISVRVNDHEVPKNAGPPLLFE